MNQPKHVFGLLALFALLAAAPAAAADEVGRSYTLHTLDYRVAETLVWDICKRNNGSADRCQVQHSGPRSLTAFAAPGIHAQIVEMLTEKDERTPASLLFEITLVRLESNGDRGGAKLASHQQKALDALGEIFPGKKATVFDTGLLRTATEGRIQLADQNGDLYVAELRLRSVVGGEEGLDFSIDLTIRHGSHEEAATMLASRLSVTEGETVVAGSSRTGAETAIVVLLTAKTRG